jgi:hypothetical protein
MTIEKQNNRRAVCETFTDPFAIISKIFKRLIKATNKQENMDKAWQKYSSVVLLQDYCCKMVDVPKIIIITNLHIKHTYLFHILIFSALTKLEILCTIVHPRHDWLLITSSSQTVPTYSPAALLLVLIWVSTLLLLAPVVVLLKNLSNLLFS